jgi:hypothetical protein
MPVHSKRDAKRKVRRHMDRSPKPPAEVTLVYRLVGAATHVFTADEFRGFHIGSSSLSEAFEIAPVALSSHVSLIYNREIKYEFDIDFARFLESLKEEPISGRAVTAKILGAHRLSAA